MQRRRLLLGAAVAIATVVTSCADDPTSSDAVFDSVVITKRAKQADFGAYKTFFLRPEIHVLKDRDEDEILESRYAQPLLEATVAGLTAGGYEQVDDKATAELAVEMVYVSTVSTSVSCYSWWDPYYWGYPGWGYYPYYGTCTSSTWRSGTLATMIVDLTLAQAGGTQMAPAGGAGGADGAGGSTGGGSTGGGGTDSGGDGNTPGDKLLGSIWFSGVYGVEYDYTQDNVTRAREGIDQAFAQSPYLTTAR